MSVKPRLKLNSTAFESSFEDLKKTSLLVVNTSVDVSSPSHRVVKSIDIKCAPTKAYVEDRFVFKMGQVLDSLATHFEQQQQAERSDVKALLPKDVQMSANNLSNHLFLERLEIEPLSVLVSVHASLKMFIGLDQSPLKPPLAVVSPSPSQNL